MPTQYRFTLTEIAKIKQFLVKTLKFVGFDAKSDLSEKEKANAQSLKLKLKGVNGVSLENQHFRFY